jgi:hypothetical protein
MIKGYDDSGRHVKLCHMPLKMLLLERRDRNRPHKHNPPRRGYTGGCLKNWPYSLETGNGHFPFKR